MDRNVAKLAVPQSWQDVAVRTAKVAVIAFAGLLLKAGLVNADWAVVEAALNAAWVAGGMFVLNAALTWANSA